MCRCRTVVLPERMLIRPRLAVDDEAPSEDTIRTRLNGICAAVDVSRILTAIQQAASDERRGWLMTGLSTRKIFPHSVPKGGGAMVIGSASRTRAAVTDIGHFGDTVEQQGYDPHRRSSQRARLPAARAGYRTRERNDGDQQRRCLAHGERRQHRHRHPR